MLPAGIDGMGAEVFDRVEPAVKGADVVMMLRIQKERLDGAGLFPNTREYSRYFGLGQRLFQTLEPDAIVMHPGPINRGVELDPAIADGNRSVILDQVTYGVAVRMAVLYLLGGGGGAEA
jgi:aspartate carbamoyltransferase catalytic subunit